MKHRSEIPTDSRRGARQAAFTVILMGAAGLAGSGCAGLSGGGGGDMAADVLEIKQQLQARNEAAEAEQRKADFRLQSLEEKIQTRTEILQNNLDEALRSQREQTEAINKLRQQVEDLTYQVVRGGGSFGGGMSATNPGLGGGGAVTAPANGSNGADQVTMTTTPEGAASAGADPTEAPYAEGIKHYNLGKYAEAAAAFEQVAATEAAAPDRRAMATYWLAESVFRQDEFERSERAFKALINQAKTLDPNSPVHAFSWRGVERLAQIKQRQGDNQKAIYYYKYILETNPGYESADRIRAEVGALEGSSAVTPAPAGSAPAESAPAAEPPVESQPTLDRTQEGA